MSRHNIEYSGKWACFSSITDSFITEFTNKAEYEEWRKEEYGVSGYKPAEQCNVMTIADAAFSIHLNRSLEQAIECLMECGLSKTECERIMYDVETKHYCPIPQDDGKYKCPNCRRPVDKNQTSCKDDSCCLKFVWRET